MSEKKGCITEKKPIVAEISIKKNAISCKLIFDCCTTVVFYII